MAKKSKKPALGRGLGALLQAQQADQSAALPDVDATETEETVKPAVDMAGTVALLPISAIEANPDQHVGLSSLLRSMNWQTASRRWASSNL